MHIRRLILTDISPIAPLQSCRRTSNLFKDFSCERSHKIMVGGLKFNLPVYSLFRVKDLSVFLLDFCLDQLDEWVCTDFLNPNSQVGQGLGICP